MAPLSGPEGGPATHAAASVSTRDADPIPVLLVVNAGSSSVKFGVYALAGRQARALVHGAVDWIGAAAHLRAADAAGTLLVEQRLARGGGGMQRAALVAIMRWLEERRPRIELRAAGHRIVHGGARYRAPVRIDRRVLAHLRTLIPLAPLHQPHGLAAIEALARARPRLPQVACFDTAFHGAQPALAREFGLPRALTAAGIRRYGFHGLSYESIARALPEHLGAAADGRVIVAHLGNGASLCALRRRRSVATTMGLTPLDGLLMGTRSGALDPGVLLYLMQEKRMDAARLARLLYQQSGLLGVSGVSADMRVLLGSADPRAAQAVELFVYRTVREIGSLAAALGGLDALIFTGGIGENSAQIRRRVCAGAAWLGVRLDPARNRAGGPRISAARSTASAWVLPAREDDMIVRHTRRLLAAGRRAHTR